jgi:KilA-N domain
MAKQTTIKVQGTEIRILEKANTDYISLTDIARNANERTDIVIANWFRNRTTVEFLGLWEQMHNPNFNPIGFDGIKMRTGLNNFILTTNEWVNTVNAIGVEARAGRYGGTYAHMDIAFEFCSWISPVFKLYFIKEFQRLKGIEAEQQKQTLDWNLKRTLAKVNYRVQTDAVKTYLMPPKVSNTNIEGLYYASEADIINIAIFGITAKEWREKNPDTKGNIRDEATATQLLVLSNLENINAEFIKSGMNKQERLERLNETAIHQMSLFADMNVVKALRKGN